MGASIIYRPTKIGEHMLDCPAPSSFQDAMRRAFGIFPTTLRSEHIPILKGMMAATGKGAEYEELIEAIETYGEIEVIEWHYDFTTKILRD